MKKINLNPICNGAGPLKYEAQLQYFKHQLLSGTYSPEKEFGIVNRKGEILHGAALFEACKQLNLPFCFLLVENKHAGFILQYSAVYSGLMNEKNYVSPADIKNILKL